MGVLDIPGMSRAQADRFYSRLSVIGGIEGDSRGQRNSSASALATRYHSYGFVHHACGLMRQCVTFPVQANCAIGGSTTYDILSRSPDSIATWLSLGVTFVVLFMSRNDRVAVPAISAEQSIINMTEIEKRIRDAGITVIWMTDIPPTDAQAVGAPVFTPDQVAAHHACINWQRSRRFQRGVLVCDLSQFGWLTTSTLGYAMPGFLPDHTHVGQEGSTRHGQALARVMSTIFPITDLRPYVNISGAYNATKNPGGTLNANPLTVGVGGTITVATGACTGVVADGHGVQHLNCTGVTTLCSKEDIVNAAGVTEPWQKLVITGTPSDAAPSVEFQNNVGVANLVGGDVVEAYCEYDAPAGNTGHSSIFFGLRLAHTESSVIIVCEDGGLASGETAFVGDSLAHPSYLLKTPPLTVPSGVTLNSLRTRGTVVLRQGVPANVTVRFRSVDCHKVINA
ncbi:SGNH/GDSL hydrolase family protein [Pseudomonas lini]|uniref:SGNH/GDSL hydrolase family protein n=1 Tax=Pseudomonas lini TaxID=163011 RepID=UPI000AE59EBE|nr:SGNH/GDSL hydrolase family protein [Pseudomonas lini]